MEVAVVCMKYIAKKLRNIFLRPFMLTTLKHRVLSFGVIMQDTAGLSMILSRHLGSRVVSSIQRGGIFLDIKIGFGHVIIFVFFFLVSFIPTATNFH